MKGFSDMGFLWRGCSGLACLLGVGMVGCPAPNPRVFEAQDSEIAVDSSEGVDALVERGDSNQKRDGVDGTVDAVNDTTPWVEDASAEVVDSSPDPDGGDVVINTDARDGGDPPPACPGEGECIAWGACGEVVPTCNEEGVWICDYSAASLYDGEVEVRCDGVDNDCDGSVDEEFGIGLPCDGPDDDLCPNGSRECAPDQQSWICGDETVEGLVESCDEIDNDCDGTVDEGFGLKQAPCDSNEDGCATGIMLCGAEGQLECVGDEACAQPNPNCVPGGKPFDPDVCACGPGIFCDSVTSSGCPLGKCQCGFLGNACVEGSVCNGAQCVIP